ncbi:MULTISPECIES: DUF6801 domain-containing protein [unclassified Amycolatopsis]|uniref:DUF6801 domain-containing protein n=1 Tax=unclassified Amycolatopsis TaxID=2618356 RepID=UPI002E0DBCA2|nr:MULTISPECIES: DUF6801 domain-containing protein [unclassified Amycolatopsis]WSJ77073.1 hypothetical protein OG439_48260 [Amycolatopsis sp. NBC_01307]WSK79375.1 hypothetical protein OG570_01900 [Amycolatopsis sp. NBC_01286]
MSRLSRLSAGIATTATAIGAIAVLTAGVASAATITYTAGGSTPVTYNCTFPGISPQPVTVVAHLDAPSSVVHSTSVTPTNVNGTATISATVHSLLTAVGYDGIRGTASVPVSVSSGTLSQPAATGLNIPQVIYPTGGAITVNIAQVATSSIPTYTAPAAAGTSTLSLTSSLSAALEFHKKSTGAWTPWAMSCTLKVTSPAQNTAFSPSITVS